jgi:hypothetical protein
MIPGLWAALAGVAGPVWLWARREGYSGIARPLSPLDRAVLEPYFEGGLLERVRIAVVAEIEEPVVFDALRAAGLAVPMEFRGVQGMCFGDVVAVTRETMAEHGASTLFHELVHTVQMRRVGEARFCRVYLREFFEYGYLGIGFEDEAFALQMRFDAGEVFEVR